MTPIGIGTVTHSISSIGPAYSTVVSTGYIGPAEASLRLHTAITSTARYHYHKLQGHRPPLPLGPCH